MAAYKKVKKNLTYEQIGELVGMSAQQVHKVEKEVINKIVDTLSGTEYNIFEVILSMCEMFGVEPHQICNKLDEKNKQHVYRFVKESYNIDHEDFDYKFLDF